MENSLDNLVWIVYVIDKFTVTDWNVGVILWMAVLAVIYIVKAFCIVVGGEDREAKIIIDLKVPKWLFVVPIMYTLYYNIVPSQETAYKMLAVYGGVEIIQNPEMQKLGGKGIEVLNKVMDDYLSEGKHETNVDSSIKK